MNVPLANTRDGKAHLNKSLIIVPMKEPGVVVVKNISIFAFKIVGYGLKTTMRSFQVLVFWLSQHKEKAPKDQREMTQSIIVAYFDQLLCAACTQKLVEILYTLWFALPCLLLANKWFYLTTESFQQ